MASGGDEKPARRKAGTVWGTSGAGARDDRPAEERVSSRAKPPVEVGKRGGGVSGQFRRSSERLESPRRVRGGIALRSESWPASLGVWGDLVVSAVQASADKAVLQEAFEDYASRGQARRLSFGSGVIEGSVQGRRFRAYELSISVPRLSESEWDVVTRALVNEPGLGSRVLAGEAPDELVGFIAGLGVEVFPGDLSGFTKTSDSKEPAGIDKHALCLLMLTAEAVGRDPFVLLQLRGAGREALIERMRQRKAVDTSSTGAAAAYEPHPGEEGESASGPLEDSLGSFWDAGAGLDEVELTVRGPEVSHPLLRRLGPSPFEEGKFPLVGVLATCYDIISAAALAAEAARDEESVDDGAGADASESDGEA